MNRVNDVEHRRETVYTVQSGTVPQNHLPGQQHLHTGEKSLRRLKDLRFYTVIFSPKSSGLDEGKKQ